MVTVDFLTVDMQEMVLAAVEKDPDCIELWLIQLSARFWEVASHQKHTERLSIVYGCSFLAVMKLG